MQKLIYGSVYFHKNYFYKIFLAILVVSTLFSCTPYNKYARISFHKTAERDSFTFTVSEEFEEENKSSAQDKENPIITKAESKLLRQALNKENYCLNKFGNPKFKIISKQQKIYDATYSHLVSQSYNARPAVPTTYFGECL